MALTSYAQVQQFITGILKTNGDYGLISSPRCVHHNFWETMTYAQFTTGTMPGGITGENGLPIPILVIGNSAASALIQALRGVGIADPDTGFINQMPDGGKLWTGAQIDEIAAWIDSQCPQ